MKGSDVSDLKYHRALDAGMRAANTLPANVLAIKALPALALSIEIEWARRRRGVAVVESHYAGGCAFRERMVSTGKRVRRPPHSTAFTIGVHSPQAIGSPPWAEAARRMLIC